MLALNKQDDSINLQVFKELCLFLLGAFFVAKILTISQWVNYNHFFRMGLEALCIIIAYSIFLLIWYTYEQSSLTNRLLGFCFFVLGSLSMFQLVFYSEKALFTQLNLACWYSVTGKLLLALVLLIIYKNWQGELNKYGGLFITISLTTALVIGFYQVQNYLPVVIRVGGINKGQISVNILLICLFTFIFFSFRGVLICQKGPAYYYLMSAVLVIILSEFYFMCRAVFIFYDWNAQLLKVLAYLFFLKGIFGSTVVYPYQKYDKMREVAIHVFDELPLGVLIYNQNLKLFFANKKAVGFLSRQKQSSDNFSYDSLVRKFKTDFPEQKKVLKDVYLSFKNEGEQIYKLKADYYHLPHNHLILFEEITENQELAILKTQIRMVLNIINKMVIFLDDKNKVVMCNQKCLAVLGVQEKEISGKHINEIVARFCLQNNPDGLKYKEMEQARELYEVTITTARGERKDLFYHIDYLTNSANEKIGALILATDVTRFKKEGLRMQQKEKLVALGQMAAGIVHEIRNPLTVIKGFSQLIKYMGHDEKIREYAVLIDREINTIDDFINDFLTYAKPSPPNLKQVSMVEIIKSMKLIIETNSFLRDINVDFTFTGLDKLIIADVNQLRQVILNIVKNAMEAVVGQKNPCIKISTHYHAQADEMSLIIFNNGRAMTPEEKMMVGTPFFTTKDKGTGLGLSICFQIIKEHNGRIEIKSEHNWGTSFAVYLPCLS